MPKASVAGATVACATPVPVNETACGLFAAESVTVRLPDSAAAVEGVNVMLIVQLAFEARDALHVVAVFAKSAELVPLITVEEMVTATVVLFESVTIFEALVLPTP